MVNTSYRKLALIGNTVTGEEVTIPTPNLEHDAENDMNSISVPNRKGGVENNERKILNLNKISSQQSPNISLSDESVTELNSVNAIANKYPSSERSWLQSDLEKKYAKESARALIEDMRESGDLCKIELFDVRALSDDDLSVSQLRNSIASTTFGKNVSSDSTARWPNVRHPTYRRYKGYVKQTKFEETGDETATKYTLNLVFEIGVPMS